MGTASPVAWRVTIAATPRPSPMPRMRCGGSNGGRGPGVERLAEEIDTLFPEARVELMTGDTIWVKLCRGGNRPPCPSPRDRYSYRHAVGGKRSPLSDADLGRRGRRRSGIERWDLRAAERTYQLLHKWPVARAADRPSRVLPQTHHPDHPVMAALIEGARCLYGGGSRAAAGRELAAFRSPRRIIVSGPDESHVEALRALWPAVPQAQDFGFWARPPPLALLRGRHRRRLLVRTARSVRIKTAFARGSVP